jgi:hypothetical protein
MTLNVHLPLSAEDLPYTIISKMDPSAQLSRFDTEGICSSSDTEAFTDQVARESKRERERERERERGREGERERARNRKRDNSRGLTTRAFSTALTPKLLMMRSLTQNPKCVSF